MNGEDHFADFDEELTSQPISSAGNGNRSQQQTRSQSNFQGNRQFSQEVFSEKISAKMRTFFVDVKESSNGRFLKISEKSRGGQKSTIMMDAEDLPTFIEALKKAYEVMSS
ncbi:hypothetical protein IPN35_03940 [Candidatus Peregrinibacteria bacterium]|nr:MAG: hypothetical protein IPN35_03940 [Candidatus Peregrinibacteria bacterium]